MIKCAVRIVLVETSHPGNIGAVARAMMNMQLDQLYLVNPQYFPHPDAVARASAATSVLSQAIVCDTLEGALSGCNLVYGASARHRRIAWPVEPPRECAINISQLGSASTAAIVLGRERTGLTNEELDQCHRMLHIPCNPKSSSLNVAAAAQIITYELFMLSEQALQRPLEEDRRSEPVATQEQMALFYEHINRVMVKTDFLDPANPRQLQRRIKRLFNRIEPSRSELNILRGLLKSIEKKI